MQDFVWWSGLSVADARAGLDMARPHIAPEVSAGQTYWLPSSARSAGDTSARAYLLPAFDEYLVGYRDRSAVLDPLHARQTNNGGGILSPVMVIDGQVVGTWKRTLARGAVTITLSPFAATAASG